MTGFQLNFDQLFRIADDQKEEEPIIDLGERKVPVHFNFNDRARRYLLYVRSDLTISVTVPRRGSKRKALEFAKSHTAWISRRISRIEAQPIPPAQWTLGTKFMLNGEWLTLEKKDGMLAIGPEMFPWPSHVVDLRPYVEACITRLAKRTLPERVQALADQFAISVSKVTVRDQSSRWGSCSRRGTISVNWRLLQMPPEVRDYIIIHELMHRREMNHSSRFWNHVLQACPLYRKHEEWIKTHAAQLGM